MVSMYDLLVPGIESPKVVCHDRKTERRSRDALRRPLVVIVCFMIVYIFGGNDLLKESVYSHH